MEWLPHLSSAVVETLVYTAIGVTLLAGLFKCVFPLLRLGRHLRRATRSVELMPAGGGTRPVWQDALFLGKTLREPWGRFLQNAEQLDARSLSCDVEEYLHEESAFRGPARLHLADVIPGLLTSLGILGTFIGLMRGIGSLDVSSADHTMQSISRMIGGISFAYGTSIAGLACSLLFNLLFRASYGSASGALYEFLSVFRELVMQRPVDREVHSLCRMEDQASLISHAVTDLGARITGGVETAISRAFVPISQSITGFILGETQGQLEGLQRIVGQFVAQMNASLGGQFEQLARTLSGINQAQGLSAEAAERTLAASQAILKHIDHTQAVSRAVIDRFEGYVSELSQAQSGNAELFSGMAALAASMRQSLEEQGEGYARLLTGQADLARQMEQYAAWSGRVLEAVEKQSDAASERAREVAAEMAGGAGRLADSYGDFVESISAGLARTMGMFEENLHEMFSGLGSRLEALAASREEKAGAPALDLSVLSGTQQAMADMTAALNRAVTALGQLAAEA